MARWRRREPRVLHIGAAVLSLPVSPSLPDDLYALMTTSTPKSRGTTDELHEVLDNIRRARLWASIAPEPFVTGTVGAKVFGMEIAERNSAQETLRLWPGEGTRLRVVDADPRHRQVVLAINEPVRRFIDELPLERGARASAPGKLLGIRNGKMRFVRETPGGERLFLVGQDERHYFIAQLPRLVNTVHEAHAVLRPPHTGRVGTKRQGEWFFVPLTAEEHADTLPSLDRVQLERSVGIPSWSPTWRGWARGPANGTPHVVDTLANLQQPAEVRMFASGVVRQSPRTPPSTSVAPGIGSCATSRR